MAYETVLRKLLLPGYEAMRGSHTLEYLREYEQQQWLSQEALAQLQWGKLQDLVAHCWEHVPFYRGHWAAAGVASPGDIRSRADFARLPVVSKQDIRQHAAALVSGIHRDSLLTKTTGGSTGEPLRLLYTREAFERRMAVMFRGYGWSGARMGEKTAYLWGTQPFGSTRMQRLKERLYHTAYNRLFLSSNALDETTLERYRRAINRFRPRTIVAYVSPLEQLARHLRATGRSMHRPLRILTAAEKLHPQQAAVIEAALGAPVFDTYGCRETMLVAAQCNARNGLHVNADHLLLECGHDPAVHASADTGDVLLTDLHNYGMPLVRYRNGDVATLREGACDCGRHLPLIAAVEGRSLDMLLGADGRIVPGEMLVSMLLPYDWIRQYQVRQHPDRSVTVLVVPDGAGASDGGAQLLRQMQAAFGEGIPVQLRNVASIALNRTGKHRVTIREEA